MAAQVPVLPEQATRQHCNKTLIQPSSPLKDLTAYHVDHAIQLLIVSSIVKVNRGTT